MIDVVLCLTLNAPYKGYTTLAPAMRNFCLSAWKTIHRHRHTHNLKYFCHVFLVHVVAFHYIVLYVLHCMALWCILLHCICIVLYCIVLYCTVLQFVSSHLIFFSFQTVRDLLQKDKEVRPLGKQLQTTYFLFSHRLNLRE